MKTLTTRKVRHWAAGLSAAVGGLVLVASGHALAQDPTAAGESSRPAGETEPPTGKALFRDRCAMCHGPDGMGTALLSRTREVALLEGRSDLAAAYVVLVSRQGFGNMPALTRGELTDEELDAIAEYLAAGPHEAAH